MCRKFLPILIFISLIILNSGCKDNSEVIPTIRVAEIYSGNVSLTEIHFKDASNGFAIGEKSMLLSTNDGGATWTKIDLGSTTVSLNSISFPSPDTGYISGNGTLGGGYLFTTTDGGTTWSSKNLPNRDLEKTVFPTPATGYAIDGGEILKYTQNNGYWSSLTQFPSSAFSPQTIFFKDDQTGWVTDFDAECYYTEDGGLTWSDDTYLKFGSFRYGRPTKIEITPNGIGYAINSTGNISKTSNGGITWTESFSSSNDNDYYLTDISIPSANVAFISGDHCLIITTNAGGTWTHLKKQDGTSISGLSSITFVTEQTGYGVAGGKILKFTRN